jgi:peptidoglycan/xylan/chitin deacetylase (PgdA/CDA1 family)
MGPDGRAFSLDRLGDNRLPYGYNNGRGKKTSGTAGFQAYLPGRIFGLESLMLGWLVGAATVVYAGYASIAPRSQLYGRTFVGLRRGSRLLALTYDDGPHPRNTPALLDVLSRHSVRATFFLIGDCVARQSELTRELAGAGHVIANHTYHHPRLIFCPPARVRSELSDCERVLADNVGEHSRLWRPPYGGRLPHVMRVAANMGLEAVMWTVNPRDWHLRTADEVEKQVSRRVRGGDVILMHDGGGERLHTVQATDRLIRRFKNEGYEFVTVPEMMRAVGCTRA